MGVKKKTKNQIIKRSKLRLLSKSGGSSRTIQGAEDNLVTLRELIWQTVAMIPKGKVASYGQIAKLVGYPNHSRYVGSTLKNLPKNTRLPWHRVVNGSLRISQRGGGEARQKRLLLKEDVNFIGDKIARAHRWDAGDV